MHAFIFGLVLTLMKAGRATAATRTKEATTTAAILSILDTLRDLGLAELVLPLPLRPTQPIRGRGCAV